MNRRYILRSIWLVAVTMPVWASPPPTPTLNFGAPYTIVGGFQRPYGVALDGTHGRLLVADTGTQRFRWTDVSTLTGAYTFTDVGFIANRSDPNALTDPQSIAVDSAGNVYVVNTLAGNVKQFTWNGGAYAINTNFCNTTPHTVAGLDINLPRDIAVGPDGAIYLLDSGNKRVLRAADANATAWTVFRSDPTWGNPYGLALDASGNLFIADTDNHRIVKIAGSTTISFGHWGEGPGEFRYPRGVAVDQFGRIFVADTFNHRVQVLANDGHHLIDLGHAPGLGSVEKVAVDSSQRVFVVDSDKNDVLAFLGASVPAPFDAFIRDFVGDPGAEPSDSHFVISSPDILVRHQADIDLNAAAAAGLETYAFQQPHYNELNYVYVAVHNKGAQQALDNFVKLYWYDPNGPSHFPADWKDSGFYKAYSDATHNTAGNTLSAPVVAGNGVVVVGPIIWRPPAPESAIAGDGQFRLGVRITNPYDYPPVGNSTTMPRDSNNVTERRIVVIRGPFPSGDQNTLVVRTHFPDLTSQTDEDVVQTRANELANWIKEVSWNQANVNVLMRGPITLPHNKTYYDDPSNSLLIEMAQDVLNNLLAAEPTLLDGSGPGHEIGRIILVTNDLASTRDWATTGSWPYTVNGQSRYLTVSVQGGNNPTPLFSHGMSHQLNLVDLYAYDNVTFPRPYVDGWDNMAKPMNGAHPLVWEKQLATWPASRNANIIFVPRPLPGTTWNNGGQPISLNYQETANSGQTIGVAFGLTNGVTSLVDETAFYYVEARQNTGTGAGADAVLPQTGVLMYYANIGIPQGQGPVILRDHVPGGDLTDAAIPLGGTEAPGGTGISVTVQPGTNGADYNLSVQYNPPATDYDVYMHPGNPNWESPDIWVDNQQNGYDEPGRTPMDRGDQAIAGEENRVYAHVFNHGPATAYDVEVLFQFSEPYHTVGGQGSFQDYMSIFIDQLAGNQDTTRYVAWTPRTGIDPHTCARVELRRLFNDTNASNNWAQRNLQVDHSEHGSPYTPVDFPFQVVNSEKVPSLIYFRADGVPKGWTWSITPPKALLNAGQMGSATFHLQPPPAEPDCTTRKIFVTGWMPLGDTLIRLGGVTVNVDLQRKTKIDLHTRLEKCSRKDQTQLCCSKLPPRETGAHSTTTEPVGTADTGQERSSARQTPAKNKRVPAFTPEEDEALAVSLALLPESIETTPPPKDRPCLRLLAGGCTNPPMPNQDIVLRYEGPDGTPVYHTVHTDSNGCYEDFNVVTEGGNWTVTAEYPGSLCAGPASATVQVTVPLPTVDHPEPEVPDPTRRLCISPFSLNAEGGIERSVREGAKARECETEATDQVLKLVVKPNPNASLSTNLQLGGEIVIHDMRQLVDPGMRAGISRSRFEWRGDGFLAVGRLVGLNALGTHHQLICTGCSEPFVVPNHWELLLDGVIVEGSPLGARVRASVAIDVGSTTDKSAGTSTLRGTVEGAIEKGCDRTEQELENRIKRARGDFAAPPEGSCNGELPCLKRISKTGRGKIVLDQFATDKCEGGKCGSYKTWNRLAVPLRRTTGESSPLVLPDGVLAVPHFVEVLDTKSNRGEHGGMFLYTAKDGTRVIGEMLGITRSGTHRRPLLQAYEPYDAGGHWEGRLWGTIIAGPQKGLLVEARYAAGVENSRARSRKLVMTLEGWLVKGCLAKPVQPRSSPTENPPVQPPTVIPPTPQQLGKLPDQFFRRVDELPRDAVERFKEADGGQLSSGGERQLRIADRDFRRLDKDKSGALNFDEFFSFYQNAQASGSKLARKYLERMDKNKDGVISREEAGKSWNTLKPLDKNGDSKLTIEELQGIVKLSAEKQFRDADLNSDGKIDFTEFVLWWRTLRPAAAK